MASIPANLKKTAADFTFGIEIECYVNAEHFPYGTIGSYHNGRQVAWLPTGWRAERDGSLSTRARNKVAVEIVSPILRGVEGLREVRDVMLEIQRRGGIVNAKCGQHIHIGVDGWKAAQLKRLLNIASNQQEALYAATGTRARERGNYAGRTRMTHEHTVIEDAPDRRFGVRVSGAGSSSKFTALNTTPIALGQKPTVECRVFGGTLQPAKAIANITMVLAMAERAYNSPGIFRWEMTPAQNDRAIARKGMGAGECEVARFGYWFGWHERTNQKRVWAESLQASDLPTIAERYAELKRRARKYDESAS